MSDSTPCVSRCRTLLHVLIHEDRIPVRIHRHEAAGTRRAFVRLARAALGEALRKIQGEEGAPLIVEDIAGVEALPGGRSRAGGVVTEAPGASPGYKAPQRTVASAGAEGASSGRGRRPGMV